MIFKTIYDATSVTNNHPLASIFKNLSYYIVATDDTELFFLMAYKNPKTGSKILSIGMKSNKSMTWSGKVHVLWSYRVEKERDIKLVVKAIMENLKDYQPLEAGEVESAEITRLIGELKII